MGERLAALLPPRGPARGLVWMSFVDSVGSGFFLAGSAVFYTRGIGLTPEQIGIGLAVASIVGFLLTVPLGVLSDRVGARRMLVVMHLWRGLWMAAMPFAVVFPLFVLFGTLQMIGDCGAMPATRSLVSAAVGEERTRVSAYMRSWRNIGFTVGAALTAPLLVLDTWWAYASIAFANGAAYMVAAVFVARMKVATPAQRRARDERRVTIPRALTDLPYLALTVQTALMMMHISVLMIGLPLWVSEFTAVPAALISVLVIVNALLAAALQVRFADIGETTEAGRRAFVRSGLALVLTCLLVAATHWAGGGAVVVVVLMVLAVLTLTAGEMWEAAGSWTLSYRYAPADREGEYLSVASLAPILESVIGPVVLTSVVIANGVTGWLVLAGVFALLVVSAWPVTRWLERSSVVAQRARRGEVDEVDAGDGVVHAPEDVPVGVATERA